MEHPCFARCGFLAGLVRYADPGTDPTARRSADHCAGCGTDQGTRCGSDYCASRCSDDRAGRWWLQRFGSRAD